MMTHKEDVLRISREIEINLAQATMLHLPVVQRGLETLRITLGVGGLVGWGISSFKDEGSPRE